MTGEFIKLYKGRRFILVMVVKKIFDGEFDEEVHSDFLKFGKGEYKNKYLLSGKKQASKWAVKAGAEYSNFFVRNCLEKISGSVEAKGVIVSTTDLRDEIKFEIKKAGNFQGVRKLQIDTEIDPAEIFDLMERFPRAFFALSFKGDDFALKIKPKAPSSGKPGKASEDGPKADFCTLKTTNKEVLRELFFDVGTDWTEVSVNHTINVTGIEYPANMAELKPTEVRMLAKRKGILTRTAIVDGVEKVSEANFVA
jgi:hypothetical protein